MIFIITLISCIGFTMMYSAASGSLYPWAIRQIIHFALFFPLMIIIATIDLKFWFKISYFCYFFVLLLLVIVELKGNTAMGATRWISLGPIKLQPSELMKISLVFALSRYFHTINQQDVFKIRYLIPPIGMILLPFVLILKQPDLGTGMILLMLGGSMFFVAGVRTWKFILVLFVALSSIPIAWKLMHEYQRKRVLIFLNPEMDHLGAGYNIIQSKIAIGSGGLTGKGLLQGSQSQLSFLPEHQTDFIFTMISEELGFVGSSIIIMLFMSLIAHSIVIAINCRNHFGRMMAMGITSIFFLHVFINSAMVMGLIPVVGVPLPLLTYGGTIMMTILIGFGLILNVHVHHNTNIGQNIKTIF